MRTPPLRILLAAALLACLASNLALADLAPTNVVLIGIRHATPPVSREEQIVSVLQNLRESSGIRPDRMLILQYHLDVPLEKKYCRETLRIDADDTVFVGVVRCRTVQGGAVPYEVSHRFPRIRDVEGDSRRAFTAALQEQKRQPNVALLIVSDRAGRDSNVAAIRQAREEEVFLRDAITTTRNRMVAAGYPTELLTAATFSYQDLGDFTVRFGLKESDLPILALAGADASGRPTGMLARVDQAMALGVDAASSRIVARWSELLSAMRQPQSHRITLRGPNGQYVYAEKGGGGKLICKSNQAGDFENFTLVDGNGFVLQNGDTVTLRSSGQKFITAEEGGGKGLAVSSGKAGPWETFTIVKIDASTGPRIKPGDRVAFRSQNGKYWTAEDGGGSKINCKGAGVGPWEAFTIDFR